MKRLTFAAACFLCVLATSGYAAVPSSVTVQGRLADSSGAPLPAGSKSFTFRVFDDSTGGTQVWPGGGGEVQSITSDASGLWIGLVGAISPLSDAVFSDNLLWLEIVVNGTTLPRTQFLTGPYAFRVSTIDGAKGGTVTSKVTIGPGHTNTGDNAFVAGNGNTVSGTSSMIGGGEQHFLGAGAAYGVIAGGYENTVTGQAGFIGAGQQNTVLGDFGVVSGGSGNAVTGRFAMIPGGNGSEAGGRFSFAAGRRANAGHAGSLVWADSTNADFASTAPNQFLIRASGGVGIGTNNPEAQLHVLDGSAGTVTASSSAAAVIERDGDTWLHILSPDADQRGILFGSPANSVMGSIRFNASTNLKGFHFRTGNNAVTLVLDSLGNLTADGCIVGSNIACLSDSRFKLDVETISSAVDAVGRLRGVRYKWNRDAFRDRGFAEGEQVGLIAQEVREVVPQAVIEQSDGYLAVDYSRLVPLLIEGVKEQQLTIEELKERLARLESRP